MLFCYVNELIIVYFVGLIFSVVSVLMSVLLNSLDSCVNVVCVLFCSVSGVLLMFGMFVMNMWVVLVVMICWMILLSCCVVRLIVCVVVSCVVGMLFCVCVIWVW